MDSSQLFYVYVLYHLNGHPCYVGKGRGPRWRRQKGRGNRILDKYIREAKLVGKNLSREKIADRLTEPEAFCLERDMISFYGRKANGGLLANMTDGGEGTSGYSWTEYSRKQLSISMKGIKRSKEACENMRRAQLGRKHSAETRAKMSVSHMGKVMSLTARRNMSLAKKGKPIPHRDKMAEAQRKIPKSPEHRAKLAARLTRLNKSRIGYFHSAETKRKMRLSHARRRLQRAA